MRFESFWYTDLVQRFGVTLRVCFTALCPVVVPKKKLLFAFLILPACGPTLAIAADSQVFFGGFAFAGSSNDASRNFPLSSVLDTLNNDGTTYLGRATREFFIQNKDKFRGINLQFDSLVRKEDSQLVLALAMTDENVSREEFGDFHKLVIQLGFELLVLDFKELQVISSQPVYLEYVDTNKKPFDDAVVRHRIQEMITGDESQLFSVLLRKANRIQTWSKNQCTLQVKRVDIGEKALSFLPERLRSATYVYAQTTAQQFSSLLSDKTGVALLPYTKDKLNTQMALRFSDGDMVNFKIPKPTFEIDLDVEGFKKVLSEQTDAESLWIYGAFLHLSVHEPELNIKFFNSSVKYGLSKTIPATQKSPVDDFPVVSEALKGAMLSAIVQMQNDKRTAEQVLKKCSL